MKVAHEFETTHNDEICCPYCRKIHGDSWELKADSGQVECCGCGKKFEYHRLIEVAYMCFPDCALNGETHRFVPRHGFTDQVICATCGEVPLTKEGE